MSNFDWDENQWPLAYLITFRTYGTWLHGDERLSVDLHGQNRYGSPKIVPNKNLERLMEKSRETRAFILSREQRTAVAQAIKNVCRVRSFALLALNVRSNHAHIVMAARQKPEPIMNAFKSNATRELREGGLVSADQRVWSRGGSTRYLWKPRHVEGAIDYVRYGQGDDLPPI